MRPLFILIPFIVAVAYGKPGGSYTYPAPTPSATPAVLSNPSIFNLQTPGASIAPSIINLSAPSIAPSLLVENVLGAGQYGQSLGFQSLGLQSLSDQSLNLGLLQSQFGWPWANQGLNLGGSLLDLGSPQLSFGSPQLSVTPPPDLSLPSAQLNIGPTVSSTVGIQGSKVQATGGGVVQKHVYVHVAPEEPEVKSPPRQIILPPVRKDYKIIFIKTPSPPEPIAPVLPPAVQDDERTLVYVLVKQPEEQPEIKIQTPPPTQPSKPEVYFLRYNTIRKESNIPVGPVVIDGRNGGDIPIVEDVAKVRDVTVPTVKIEESGPQTSVDLNLNKASLSGGSALSLAVTGAPLESTLHVSSTPPPKYGPPEEK